MKLKNKLSLKDKMKQIELLNKMSEAVEIHDSEAVELYYKEIKALWIDTEEVAV